MSDLVGNRMPVFSRRGSFNQIPASGYKIGCIFYTNGFSRYRTLTLWDDFFEQTKMAEKRINNEDADTFLDVN